MFTRKIRDNNIIRLIVLSAIVMSIVLFFFIPYITEKYTIESIINNSKNSVEQIKLTRAYYVDSIVDDVKKYAPNLSFSYDHEGINGRLPLPTTTIHDLSKIFSENTGIKYNLYSNYPFKNRERRVLTKFQKQAIRYTQENPQGLYIKRDIVDGKEVLRVAVTDYMTSQSCVNCHNNHPDRIWEKGKWKLGDKRGVLEVITPIDEELSAHRSMRNYIIIFILSIFLLMLFYLAWKILHREKELLNVKDILEDEVNSKNKKVLDLLKLVDEYVIASKTDTKGIITYASKAFCNISEYSKDELLGKTHNIVRHPSMGRDIFMDMWKTIQSGKIWTGEVLNRTKSNGLYWVKAVISPDFDETGNIIGYSAVRHNIADKKRADYLMEYDYLTSLLNRASFERKLAQSLKNAKKNNTILSVLFIDFDNFKNINDTLGHHAGDTMLKIVSNRMKLTVKDTDTLARIGGDEFVILLENIHNRENIISILERILMDISKVIEIDMHKVYTTVSIGVAVYPDDGNTMLELMKNADKAMYHTKEIGKNSYSFYTKKISEKIEKRAKIENVLRKAIRDEDFYLLFQPKYDLFTYEVIGCEALVRIKMEDNRYIMPSEFIPIAEETKLIIPMGMWIMRNACKSLRTFRMHGIKIPRISINISSIQLKQVNIIEDIIKIIGEEGLTPNDIELELTEYSLMEQSTHNINLFRQLKEKGFTISIDDFGTGYSSIEYIRKMPIDVLKIDKIFIDHIDEKYEDQAIVESIIGLSKGLHFSVLAEGIERESQEKVLQKLSCSFGQGNLYSKPLTESELIDFILKRK